MKTLVRPLPRRNQPLQDRTVPTVAAVAYRPIAALVVCLAVPVLLGGCSDLLDVAPRTAVTPEDLGQDEVEQLLNGLYIQFQNGPGRNNVLLFDMMGGELRRQREPEGHGTFIDNDFDPSLAELERIWDGYYRGVYRTNVLIETLSGLDATPRNQQILGMAHFFRAYAYYGLVTRWGGVPILRENTQDLVARDSEEDVWAFIEEELGNAIDLSPTYESGPDYFYVTSEAAQALLARTLVAQGKMEQAAQVAEQVIESSHFDLEADFEAIFRGSNSETIFAFENRPGEENTFSALLTTNTWPTGGSYFFLPTEEVLTTLFSADDRRTTTVFTYDDDQPMANKYVSGLQGGDPLPVARIAEMYLISAEAQGLQGLGRLNELRRSRGLAPLSISNEHDYQQAVFEERRKELIYEGFRFFDLVRTDRAIDVLFNVTSETQFKLPIPQQEIDLNPSLVQNPGY